MRFFFKSRKFKIGAGIVAAVLALSLLISFTDGLVAPHTSIFGAVVAPFQKLAGGISDAISSFSQKIGSNETIILENARLKEEIDALNEKITDYDTLKSENDFYKDYLEIKERHPDFKFCNAVIISRDNTDIYSGLTLDSGSLSGIELYDPVITSSGLVGYVSEVGLTTSKVTTVLDASISVGAIDSRTRDAGVIGGSLENAKEGKTRMHSIKRSAGIAIGDYIVTSGSGVFPSGLLIGKITNISNEEYASGLYATVEPFADLKEARQVMVITDFAGKVQEENE
ncbi:MAG: rod shape-determining protein MreC [Clostridiales bacterium]|nr:rod shape-determining protein MreC [Candidatus Equinaster intestinalis]